MSPPLSDAQIDKIRELITSGQKIEAIKVYREMTGVGLKEAKDAIDALAAGQPIQVSALSAASLAAENSTKLLDEVKRLVHQGNKIEAIKVYRGMTGVGLGEAKMAVEALASGQPVTLPALGSNAEMLDEVKRLARQGRKIEAIKLYCKLTGVGLVEAKNAVEQMEVDLKSIPASVSFGAQETPGFSQSSQPTISPNPFDEPEKPSVTRRWLLGCSLAALVGLCVAIPLVLMWFGRWPFGQ